MRFTGNVIGIVSLVISLLVVSILVITAMNRYTGTRSETVVKQPVVRAQTINCLSKIRKVESAIQVYFIENGKYPEHLSDLTELSSDDLYCPLTGRAFSYSSITGKVFCPDHGP